ncbi:MAG TPA: DUF2723 domain-containing protein [Candidatus Limnocylindrales bacterium]
MDRRVAQGPPDPGRELPADRRRPGSAIAAAVGPVAVAAIALVLIRSTLMPGLAFWDTAEFQVLGPVMGTGHSPGYPTYAILGWLASAVFAPFGDPAFRMNLFSAVCLAGASGLMVVLVRLLTGSMPLGIAAGVGLATTPLAWRLGSHAEGHTLHLLFVALLFVALVAWDRERRAGGGDRWLVAAAVGFGISVGNHSLTLLLAIPIAAYVLAVEPRILHRPRLVATCLLAAIGMTVLVYLELPLRAGPFRAPFVYGTPNTWDGFWYVALAEQFRGAVGNPIDNAVAKLATLVGRTVAEFGIASLLIPFGFLAALSRQPRYALLSGLALVGTVVFAGSYTNADITRYYLGPVFIAWTWLAFLGAAVVDAVRATGRRYGPTGAGDRFSPGRVAIAVIVAALLLLPTLVDLRSRFGRIDQSRDVAASRWLDGTLDALEPNAVVVSWWSYSTPLWYGQLVEGRRPDIRIVDDRTRLDERLGEVSDVVERARAEGRPIYLIRADERELADLRARYRLERVGSASGNLVRVLGPRTADAADS